MMSIYSSPAECACDNGICNDGLQGDGSCDCFPGWKGPTCQESTQMWRGLWCNSSGFGGGIWVILFSCWSKSALAEQGGHSCMYMHPSESLSDCPDSFLHVSHISDVTSPTAHELWSYLGETNLGKSISSCSISTEIWGTSRTALKHEREMEAPSQTGLTTTPVTYLRRWQNLI